MDVELHPGSTFKSNFLFVLECAVTVRLFFSVIERVVDLIVFTLKVFKPSLFNGPTLASFFVCIGLFMQQIYSSQRD